MSVSRSCIPNFPEEILSIIASLSCQTSLKDLSLASKAFRRIVLPELFRIVSTTRLTWAEYEMYTDEESEDSQEGGLLRLPSLPPRRSSRRKPFNLAERCRFVAPYARLFIVRVTPRFGVPIRDSTDTVHQIVKWCPRLARIQDIPHELLYSASLVSVITAHPALNSVEVIAKFYGHDNSRRRKECLPCTPLFKYDFTSSPAFREGPHFIIPELRDSQIHIHRLTIEGSLTVLEELTSCRRVFSDAFTLHLIGAKYWLPSQMARLLLDFVRLQSCQIDLRLDSFDLFITLAHNQSPSLPQPTKKGIKHLMLFSSLWKRPTGTSDQNNLICEQVSVCVSAERDIGNELAFFHRLLPYIPTLKVLRIDLGYYVGKDTAERRVALYNSVKTIMSLLHSAQQLSRLEIHFMGGPSDADKDDLVLSATNHIPKLRVFALGGGFETNKTYFEVELLRKVGE